VSYPHGEEKHASGFADAADGKGFAALTTKEVLHEQRSLLQQLEGMQTPTGSRAVIFRSDHASNYLPLRGNLPRDREKLLVQLGAAQRGDVRLRPEWMRGL